MNSIKIFPIFNQSAPGVWDDFVRIRVAAMRHNYNVHMTDDQVADMLARYSQDWAKNAKNFAFGAYDGANMVGCIHGDCSERLAVIRHLYVLPEYQSYGIGRRLVSAMESACSFEADELELVALHGATPFYSKVGCISPDRSNYFIKDISNSGHCAVVPLFWCTKYQGEKIANLSNYYGGHFKPSIINRYHLPVFAYRNIKGSISGIVYPDAAHSFSLSSFVKNRLDKTMANYKIHQELLANKKHR